jgi:hypothetical protein
MSIRLVGTALSCPPFPIRQVHVHPGAPCRSTGPAPQPGTGGREKTGDRSLRGHLRMRRTKIIDRHHSIFHYLRCIETGIYYSQFPQRLKSDFLHPTGLHPCLPSKHRKTAGNSRSQNRFSKRPRGLRSRISAGVRIVEYKHSDMNICVKSLDSHRVDAVSQCPPGWWATLRFCPPYASNFIGQLLSTLRIFRLSAVGSGEPLERADDPMSRLQSGWGCAVGKPVSRFPFIFRYAQRKRAILPRLSS